MKSKQIRAEDRFYIQKRLEYGDSRYKIVKDLGFAYSTLFREIKRNQDPAFKDQYNHLSTNRIAKERRSNASSSKKLSKLLKN